MDDKYFTINVSKIHELIDSNNTEDVTYTEMLALLYLIQGIDYNRNTISVTPSDRDYLKTDLKMSVSSIGHFFSKMVKLGIFFKIKKDFYGVKKDYIIYGPAREGNGKFVKVHAFNLYKNIRSKDTKMSAIEIKLFLYILNSIEFKSNTAAFGGNTITLTKDSKAKLAEKFDICERTFKNFMKSVKDLDLLIKLNNTLYRINDLYIVAGGDFADEQYVKPEKKKKTEIKQELAAKRQEQAALRRERGGTINKFFDGFGKGDDKNEE